jgi:hypothetical protein
MTRLSWLFESIARAGVHVELIVAYGDFRPTDRLIGLLADRRLI